MSGGGPGFFRPPLRRLTVTVIVAAVVVGGIVWFFGLDIPQSVLVAVAFAGVGVTWIAVEGGEKAEWPLPPVRRTPGARRDVEALTWSMKTRGGVAGQSLARVREATRHRLLFLYGLDLYDPADRSGVEGVLAPGVVRILLNPKQTNLDLAAFTRCLSALERLGAPTSAAADPRTSDTRTSDPRTPDTRTSDTRSERHP
ncbi:hypothetical protein [Frondihabitans sp. PAMC 28766]|uniref:hypothetical protein n=1 Tax=Frondihabitans sp. PAMC 28766 TaxID=1795630 RepID=UPI0012FFA317|nr:hypothetical protein [Frondihabitans sp. PAMC 28766]